MPGMLIQLRVRRAHRRPHRAYLSSLLGWEPRISRLFVSGVCFVLIHSVLISKFQKCPMSKDSFLKNPQAHFSRFSKK